MGTNIILEVTILINQLKSHHEADKFRVDNITQHVLYYNIIGDFQFGRRLIQANN